MTSRKGHYLVTACLNICTWDVPGNPCLCFDDVRYKLLIGWHQIWVDCGPVGGLGRVPRPPSGPGSHPLALGHQLGMTFTKARPKFSSHVIIQYKAIPT